MPIGRYGKRNPDAGNANTGDSNGMAVWVTEGARIKGKFVEVTADRATHQFVSRGEISFLIRVRKKFAVAVPAKASPPDAEGRRSREPI